MAIGYKAKLVITFAVARPLASKLGEASCFGDLFALLSTHRPFSALLLTAHSCWISRP